MTRRIRIQLEYDGTEYAGWQLQRQGERTVQGVLEEALNRITGENVRVFGAGRTDSGVHAMGQAAHFDLPGNIAPESIPYALNANLPDDIRVFRADEMPEDFDARRHTRGKIYRYRIYNSRINDVFLRRYAWHIKYPLNSDAMQSAANFLVGKHDFSSFQAADCAATNAIRHVYMAHVIRSGDIIDFEIFATAFLKQMVRNIVGTLEMAGCGKIKPEGIVDIMQAGNRSRAGMTAPAHGLTLVKVFYADDPPPPELAKYIPDSADAPI